MSPLSELLHSAFCILHSFLPLAATAAPSPAASPAPLDIHPILPPEKYFIETNNILLVVPVVCLLLAGLLAWYLLRRPKVEKPGPVVSPRDAARKRLAELETRMETMDARTFGGEVCDVLRAYIGGEYGLHPERQTSPEFLASVSSSRVFSRNEHGLLSEFLDGCDLLKFARIDATLAGKRDLLAQAAEFIDGRKEPEEAPPPLPTEKAEGRRQKVESI